MLQKTLVYVGKFCGCAAEVTLFYLALTSKHTVSISTIRYIVIMILIGIFSDILEHLKIEWSWNSRYFKDDNDRE